MKCAWIVTAAIWFLALAGCTHLQLRNDAVNESAAVGDLAIQQVMNNLAMFVYDPNSMPYFSYPNQGAASVVDQGSASMTAGWSRPITTGDTSSFAPKHFASFLLSALGFTGSASRSSQEGFVMTPILDPRKLELMRCAYQQAVASCGCGQMSQNCPDCQARFNKFYTGDPNGDIAKISTGTVTSNCLKGPCWFHVGTEKSVPKDCPCLYVGHNCGVYVWVDHDGRGELTKLTLAILDYAINSSPVQLTKEVTYNIDELGLPTSKNDAVGTVKATVGIDEKTESLLHISEADEARIEQILLGRRKTLQDRYAELNPPNQKPKDADTQEIKQLISDIAVIDAKLTFLQEQLRTGALKEQFSPGGASPAPNGLLQLQLYQNNLTPQLAPSQVP